MKQAFKTTFEGFGFYIDEDARLVLFEFIEKSEIDYQNNPKLKGQWESFKNALKQRLENELADPDKVLTIQMLDRIISQLSSQFATGDDTHFTTHKSSLHRDTEASMVGGVCAGMAKYLNMDTGIVRLITLLLIVFTGIGLLAYIILWIVLPALPRQYPLTGENRQSSANHDVGAAVQSFFRGIGHIFSVLFKGVGTLLGIVLLLVGVFILLGVFRVLPWHHMPRFHFDTWDPNLQGFFYNVNHDKLLFLFCVALLIAIPVLALVFNILRGLLGPQKRNRGLRATTIAIWFLCLFGAIGIAVSNNGFDKPGAAHTIAGTLDPVRSNSIYIEKAHLMHPEIRYVELQNIKFRYNEIHFKGSQYLYGKPNINIVRTSDENYYKVVVNKNISVPMDRSSPYTDLHRIAYAWEQHDSVIRLDRHFFLEDGNWWQFPKVDVDIIIPEGKNILYINPEGD
jgi:phage shock protein PspC (stress-responsive transcriptional regulator)